MASDSLRILKHTYKPINYTFVGAVRGGEGFRLAVSVNGGAVTCGESGFSTQYSRTSASAIGFQMTLSCVYYATLPKLARVSISDNKC